LEEKSTYRKLDRFLGARDRDVLDGNDLVDEAIKNVFTLFWKTIILPAVEAFSCFWE